MSIELCVLASGSAGNCTVVRTPAGVFLIDCGIGPRTVTARLAGTGVTLRDISAVCLTHLDRDHFNPVWISTFLKLGIRVFCAVDCVETIFTIVGHKLIAPLLHPFANHPFEPVPGVSISAFRVAHDQEGSHAFFIEGFGTRAGFATDLGSVPIGLIEKFCGVDLLAIESNYDPDMQTNSSRPWFLKQRIMGGRGHLSNAQSLTAVRAIFDRCQKHGHRLPQHVLLLHRSRQCNCPNLLRTFFLQDHRLQNRLVLSEQFERTEWLAASSNPVAGEQLAWAWA